MFPALRFFNNENYQKIISARQRRKEQMDPYIERTKVMSLGYHFVQRVEIARNNLSIVFYNLTGAEVNTLIVCDMYSEFHFLQFCKNGIGTNNDYQT